MSAPVFDNSYARLPASFYAVAPPSPSPSPSLVQLNESLAAELGLDPSWLSSEAGLGMLSGSKMPEGAEPIAMAYAGHQFGTWVPRLGDGRATLLGEVLSPDGVRFDVQLKGSGRTAFSRRGDGKAVLGPVLREYVVSEAMTVLGVPSTRALAAVTTGERVLRNGPEPGAVLTRVARSHVRVGTFQYHAATGGKAAVRHLADYVIARHYPHAAGTGVTEGAQGAGASNPYRALLQAVIERQADLIAHWMSLGFIHGVMNTDNMQVAGETIDYGPCAFMDAFHPNKVFSSIDHHGRYAWSNQPRIAMWNLSRLAETLLPLLDKDEESAVPWAEQAIKAFSPRFDAQLTRRFRAKLGLLGERQEHDELLQATFKALTEGEVDFTRFFRLLTRVAAGDDEGPLRALFTAPELADAWLARWRQSLAGDAPGSGSDETSGAAGAAEAGDTSGAAGVAEAGDTSGDGTSLEERRVALMRRHNPVFIPRNHRIEEAIEAGGRGDYAPFRRLVEVLARPFDEQPEHADLERPPEPHEVVQQTFCGT